MAHKAGFFQSFWKKLRGQKTQTQGIFRKNSSKKVKKSESSTQKRGKKRIFFRKTHIFLEKLSFFSTNSRIFEKLKQNFSKNSRNRKVQPKNSKKNKHFLRKTRISSKYSRILKNSSKIFQKTQEIGKSTCKCLRKNGEKAPKKPGLNESAQTTC